MIDEKKLIEALNNNDGMDFEVPLKSLTVPEVGRTAQAIIDKMKEGFINLINAQPKVGGGWIPMTERRPTAEDANSDGVVLVRWKNVDSTEEQYVDSPMMMHSWDLFSHWMHCPEPPKGCEG